MAKEKRELKDFPIEGATLIGDTLHLELWYPRSDDALKKIQIGLVDLRVADDIRISFSFPRNGWVIEEIVGYTEEEVPKEIWQEAAFIGAWREKSSSSGE